MTKTFNQIYEEYEAKTAENYKVMCFNGYAVTFAEFKNRVSEIMKQLIRLGVKEGTGVGYTLRNSTEIIPLFIAISRLGAYAFPQFTGIPAIHRMMSFQKVEIAVVITNDDMADDLKMAASEIGYEVTIGVIEKESRYPSIYGDVPEMNDLSTFVTDPKKEDLPLMIGSSSGTTGLPKMVVMTQKNIGSEMIVSIDMQKHKLHLVNENTTLMAFPFSTSVMLVLCGIMFSGTTIVFSDDMSPMNFLHDIENCKVDSLTCPPAYLESLLLFQDKHPYDVSSVTSVCGGMDFFSPSLLRRLQKMFPNMHVYTGGYGLVETCNIYMFKALDMVNDNLEDSARYELSDDAENIIKVCDEDGNEVADGAIGEVYVKGPNVVKGYMETPAKVLEIFPDGWLRTGDICEKVSNRIIKLIGRKKYFIKRGGKSISPIVVQTEINKTEGIIDSGVIGVPHPLYGEMIWAFVVKAPGSKVTLKEIKMTCKKELPYYMLPDQVTFIEQIPKKGGVGKVDFETLKRMGKEEFEKITSGKA